MPASVRSVAVAGYGMVTSVGLNAPASAAAIRAGVSNARETTFIDWGGERIVAHAAPLDIPAGRGRLVRMIAMAINECVSGSAHQTASELPLVLCVAEPGRPGRMDRLDESLIAEIEADLGIQFAATCRIVAEGRVGGLIGVQYARSLIQNAKADAVVVAGVDGYVSWPTLSAFETRHRLLTSKNSNGFMPGEAAGAVLITAPQVGAVAVCEGIGFGTESATLESGEPLRGTGLAHAIRAAAADADSSVGLFDFRISDVSGEQYYFREGTLAMARLIREPTEEAELWHPADCIGEVGAAAGPIALALAAIAFGKGYAPGPTVLCHFSSDDGKRAAAMLSSPVSR